MIQVQMMMLVMMKVFHQKVNSLLGTTIMKYDGKIKKNRFFYEFYIDI